MNLIDEDERGEPGSPAFRESGAGQVLGRYVVLGELGKGGMGTVLKAYDEALDRAVAIKILHPGSSQWATGRLKREAQALAKLSHPNVVQVHEVGEAQGQTFIVMELVQGRTLLEWAKEEPPPSWRECVQAYLQAGAGLAAAHAEELVHRDFKPSNAVIDDKHQVRVLDFGLARQMDGLSRQRAVDSPMVLDTDPALEVSLTRSGMVLGTPAYMSPEQMQGQDADARSDQFSFCVSLYEALYGERPFDAKTLAGLLMSVKMGRLQPAPKGTNVPPKLREALLRGLSPDPSKRWLSMEPLLMELLRLVAPRTARWWVISASIVGLGLLVGGFGLTRLAALQHRERQEWCSGARAHLHGVWDRSTRALVAQGFASTKWPAAADTAQRVSANLDRYTEAWVEQRTAVCEATRVHGEQSEMLLDVRMMCLDRRLGELGALVRVLGDPDDGTVSRADTAVAQLRRPEPCAAAQPGAQSVLPEDPTRRRRYLDVQAQLDEAQALLTAGRYPEGRDRAAAAGREAEQEGFRALLAASRISEGSAHRRLREADESQRLLREGIMIASEVGDERTEFLGWSELLGVAGLLLEAPESAAHWRFAAESALERAGSPKDLESQLTINIGAVLIKQNRFEEATRTGEDALRIAVTMRGRGSLEEAQALSNLGVAAAKQSDWVLAERRLRESHELKRQILGPDHPTVVSTGMNLANVLAQRAKKLDGEASERTYDEAEDIFEHVIAFGERVDGPSSLKVARTLTMLGVLQRNRGELSKARRSQERALSIFRGLTGVEGEHALALAGLARIESAKGNYERAEAHEREALEIQRKKYGDSHLSVGRTRMQICQVLADAQDYARAIEECERALPVLEQAFEGRANPLLVVVHGLLARANRAVGEDVAADTNETKAADHQRALDASAAKTPPRP